MRNLKDYILLFVKGLCMGAADAIPGVSGGSIAFITGIYDELLNSIKSVDLKAFKLLKELRFKEFWQKVNGQFLLFLVGGIACGLIVNLLLISYLLKKYPILVWSFFFGLILISAPLILRSIKKWSPAIVLFFILGVVLAYRITVLSPTSTPDAHWFIFLAGALAICAMILPGISGAFILLLLGKYEFMSNALHELRVGIVLTFLAGCLIGITSFSRILTWILDRYHNLTLALLSGFMLGSLNKLWPWREVVAFRLDREGKQLPAFDKSVWPSQYMEKSGNDPKVFQAILMMALGVILVVLIEKIAERLKTKF